MRSAPRSTGDTTATPARAEVASRLLLGRQREQRQDRAGLPLQQAPHWKRAPARVRRWDRPTSLRPSGSVTSPVPRPPKQTRRDHCVVHSPPSWTSAGTPSAARASAHARPSHRKARATSSSHSGSPAGSSTSSHRISTGLHQHRSSPAAPPGHLHARPVDRRSRRRPRLAGHSRGRASARSDRTPRPSASQRIGQRAGVECGRRLPPLLDRPGHADSVVGWR